MLHSYVRERLAGYLDDLDVEAATEEEVRMRVAERIAQHDQQRVAERIERLRAELGREGRATGGAELEEAIEAAIAQDAEVLPVDGPDLGPLGGVAAILRF